MPCVHVIGAGVAGLAAAMRAQETGRRVCLHEAAPQAGGRCRSFLDRGLDRIIDNGTHLLLSGNTRVRAYLETVGAADTLVGPSRARLDFVDLACGARWTLAPSPGRLPWWILDPGRRVPGTRARDYLGALRLLRAKPEDTVAGLLAPDSALYRRLWAPLCVGVLNTPPETAAARLLAPVLIETFGRGEAACRPRLARDSLSATFVDPAVAWLRARGAEVRFGRRLVALEPGLLRFADGESLPLGPRDQVILAVPPGGAAALVPGLIVPEVFHPIVNVHFRLETPPPGADDPEHRVPLGILGGLSEWLFVRRDVLSVTISAALVADALDPDILGPRVWAEVVKARPDLDPALPPFRVIKERRATVAQTPDQTRRRPSVRGGPPNVLLAGDWTETKLPATLEGAIRSGETAAFAALHQGCT